MPHPPAKPAPPKTLYGVLMGVVCLIAVGASAGIASAMRGDSGTVLLAAASVGIGAIATFLPVLFGGRTKAGAENFGLLVLFASGARTLLIMAVALFFSQTREIVKAPFWVGTMSGAGVILVIESIVSITILSRLERLKTAQSSAAQSPPATNDR